MLLSTGWGISKNPRCLSISGGTCNTNSHTVKGSPARLLPDCWKRKSRDRLTSPLCCLTWGSQRGKWGNSEKYFELRHSSHGDSCGGSRNTEILFQTLCWSSCLPSRGTDPGCLQRCRPDVAGEPPPLRKSATTLTTYQRDRESLSVTHIVTFHNFHHHIFCLKICLNFHRIFVFVDVARNDFMPVNLLIFCFLFTFFLFNNFSWRLRQYFWLHVSYLTISSFSS